LSLFDFAQDLKPAIELAELFQAYFDCRNNKRNTINALALLLSIVNQRLSELKRSKQL